MKRVWRWGIRQNEDEINWRAIVGLATVYLAWSKKQGQAEKRQKSLTSRLNKVKEI